MIDSIGLTQAAILKADGKMQVLQPVVVKLPKAVAFKDDVKEVDVVAMGNRRIISPAGTAWDEWFDEGAVSPDFMENWNQPPMQIRDLLDD